MMHVIPTTVCTVLVLYGWMDDAGRPDIGAGILATKCQGCIRTIASQAPGLLSTTVSTSCPRFLPFFYFILKLEVYLDQSRKPC